MAALLLGSAFFSASEAALFSLGGPARARLAVGNRAQRIAARLLADPDRLLTAVLFWNLVVNLAYFTIVSIAGLQLERQGHPAEAGVFAVGSLLAIIILSEMLPKSLGVLQPFGLITLLGVPLAATVRAIDPILPGLRLANLLSRRLFCPRFQAEPYLHVSDLERAVQLSTQDAALIEQEQSVLENIVSLSEIRADELMRPRIGLMTFRPPVALADLKGRMTPSGYLLVTEPHSDEVASAVDLRGLSSIPESHLEHCADPVVYVPWSTSVAAALEVMRHRDRQVAAVVNEFGETIGILTFEDIVETIFTRSASRTERLLQREPLGRVGSGRWQVSGMTSLRRLVRRFDVPRPPSKSVTVAGVIQEALERLPQPGDECRWGPFEFRVLEAPDRGQLLVELTLAPTEEDAP
jgi:putative hemolysin